MMSLRLCRLLGVFCLIATTSQLAPDTSVNLDSIVFGSCSGLRDRPTPIFEDIAAERADLWLWLGDVAYVDHRIIPAVFVPSSPDHVEATYQKAKSDPNYQEMIQKFQILGVWDDHDFNQNNGNKSNPTKDWVQQIFLRYLDEPEDSPRWSQKGLYISYNYGDSQHRVKLILLDLRYFSDSWYTENADNLGTTQWRWLEAELANNDARFTIFGFSIQFLPHDAPLTEKVTPYTRQKILSLLAKYKTEGVLFLSGDVHLAQLMRSPCPLAPMKYPIHEFTSSGLSHHATEHIPFSGIVMETIRSNAWDWTPLISDFNYGQIDFDWSNLENPRLILTIKGRAQKILAQKELDLESLTNKTDYPTCEELGVNLDAWPLALAKLWDSLFHVRTFLTLLGVTLLFSLALYLAFRILMIPVFVCSKLLRRKEKKD